MQLPQFITVASLMDNCKLNDIDPLGYLTNVLTRIVNGHPNRDIDQLLPWGRQKARTQGRPRNGAYEACMAWTVTNLIIQIVARFAGAHFGDGVARSSFRLARTQCPLD